MKKPYRLKKRGKYWYYKLPNETTFHSTGETSRLKAENKILEIINEHKTYKNDLTLKEYSQPFYQWDACPHIRRLIEENKSITKRHTRIQRGVLEKYIWPDKISKKRISEIRRADILDFRSRLLKIAGPRTVNRTIGILKVIFKEGIYREELERDPTLGVGNIKYAQKQQGIFSKEELERLFPNDSYGPWSGLLDYTCFLLAASTGMRRGEVLALPWKNLNLEQGYVIIDRAWKDRSELGKPKWGRARITPFLLFRDKLVIALYSLKEESIRINPEDFVFCYDNGHRLGDTWWKEHFNNAIDKIGIDRKNRNLHPHSFRHTLNTLLRNAGKDPVKIRKALGWRDENIQDNYTHFIIDHLKDLELK